MNFLLSGIATLALVFMFLIARAAVLGIWEFFRNKNGSGSMPESPASLSGGMSRANCCDNYEDDEDGDDEDCGVYDFYDIDPYELQQAQKEEQYYFEERPQESPYGEHYNTPDNFEGDWVDYIQGAAPHPWRAALFWKVIARMRLRNSDNYAGDFDNDADDVNLRDIRMSELREYCSDAQMVLWRQYMRKPSAIPENEVDFWKAIALVREQHQLDDFTGDY